MKSRGKELSPYLNSGTCAWAKIEVKLWLSQKCEQQNLPGMLTLKRPLKRVTECNQDSERTPSFVAVFFKAGRVRQLS